MTTPEYIAYMRANPQEWGAKAEHRCTSCAATITVSDRFGDVIRKAQGNSNARATAMQG